MKRPMVSFARLRRVVFMVGVAALLGSLAVSAHAVTIDWVTVGDPGNTADTTTYGAVTDVFQIMKYEFTNQQYTDFLNSVDPSGTNPNSVYNSNQGSDARGGISFTSGNASGSKYAVRSNMGDKPVNYVSWFDAARVSNWYQNGATGSSSTDTGAYTLGGANSGATPAVNAGAKFFIPTEDMWYKAAYYKGGSTNAGYWTYATQSDTLPSTVTANEFGIGSATSGNFSNIMQGADWNGQDGNVVTVGTAGGPSAYDAYNFGGNVSEWNDLAGLGGAGINGDQEGRRGGNWKATSSQVGSSARNLQTAGGGLTSETAQVGFRLAAPVAVPEPSTWVMGAVGLACGGWQMYRRRRGRA